MKVLARFAARADVPIFAAVGGGALRSIEALSLREALRFCASPRQANLLLIAGHLRDSDHQAVKRIHDQLPEPRATLCWGCTGEPELPGVTRLPAAEDPLPFLQRLYRQLLLEQRPSEGCLLPDQPPEPWRGLGDHGQGGEGMMGGVPYGRPMAMPDADLRDGLQLDACTVRLGPFLSAWPPGLVLELTLQGDVVQQARVIQAPFASPGSISAQDRLCDLARLLYLLESLPRARRVWHLALGSTIATPSELAGLRKQLRYSGVLAAIPESLGLIESEAAKTLGLGEKGEGSHIVDRLEQWLAEAQGGGRPSDADGDENTEADLPHLTELLVGLEWHEARLVIASFDGPTLQKLALPDDVLDKGRAKEDAADG